MRDGKEMAANKIEKYKISEKAVKYMTDNIDRNMPIGEIAKYCCIGSTTAAFRSSSSAMTR